MKRLLSILAIMFVLIFRQGDILVQFRPVPDNRTLISQKALIFNEPGLGWVEDTDPINPMELSAAYRVSDSKAEINKPMVIRESFLFCFQFQANFLLIDRPPPVSGFTASAFA